MKKIVVIPGIIILVLVAIRVAAPPLILSQVNNKLESFSPTLEGHVQDLDLSLLGLNTTLEEINMNVKSQEDPFLKVKSLKLFLDGSALLSGKIVTSFSIDGAELTYSKSLIEAVKKHQAAQPPSESPDIKVTKVTVKNSSMNVQGVGLPEKGRILSHFEGEAKNLIPDQKETVTSFDFKSEVFKSGKMEVIGAAETKAKPMDWSIDGELLNFNLAELNDLLRKKVPLTFTRGKLDLYMEAKSEGKKVKGYIKPFVDKMDVLESDEEMKGAKHWFFELISGLAHVAVEKDQVTATKIPFVFDGKMKTDTGEAISKAFEHATGDKLKRGIEHSLKLD